MQGKTIGLFKKITGFKEFFALVAVLGLALIIYAFNSKFFGLYNIQGVLRQISIFGFLGLGAMLVIITGGIDLSPGSMLAFFGVISAMLMRAGLGFIPTILIMLVFCAGIGAYHGVMVSRAGIAPFIVTLGSLSIFRGLAVISTNGYPIPIKIPEFLWLGQGLLFNIPVPFIIFIVVALIINYMLNNTVLGRHIYAVGGNIEAAKLSGIPIRTVLTKVYIMATMMFGLSAFVMAGRLGQGMPGIGIGYELNAIAAAVIGGTSLYGGIGTVFGTILGAALMALIDNLLVLLRVEPWWNEVVIGVVIVAAVAMDMIASKRRMTT